MVPARPAIPAYLVLGITACLTIAAGPRAAGQQEEPRDSTRSNLKRLSPPEQVETDVVTREAVCRWANRPPVLDGKLDDRCWQDAVAITRFASYWDRNKTPRPGTRAYLVWDDEALYYGATMADAELRSYGKHRNDTLWDGDVFEMFFKPSVDRPAYYEFQANPREFVFECAFRRSGDFPKDFTQAPILGNKAVVRLDGTLDHPGDRDKSWTVEGRIPWTAFQPTGGKPKPADEWRFAICRYDYGPQGTRPILMSSAPLTRPSFHRVEDYGKLRFEGPRP
jgi:hypothetical protein